MKIRTLEYARELAGHRALSSALILGLLSLSASATAQEDDPFATESSEMETSEEEATEAPVEEEAPTPEEEYPSEQEEPAEETPAAEEAEAEAEASADGEVSAEASLDATETPASDPGTSGFKPPKLAIERLPMVGTPETPSAYPNDPIVGLPGGSLSLTINRMQWPYMPKYGGDEPAFRVGFSGSSWVDANYRHIDAGNPSEENQTEYRMQGRLKLRVNPVYNFDNDWFVQSSLEFVGNTEQNHSGTNYVDVDEAWVRFGKWKLFDITVGRTQGFEVYHFGMGLDLNTYERAGAVSQSTTPAAPYGLTDLWDRGLNNGAAALHVYPVKWFKFEFLTRMGLNSTGTDIGIRPVGVVDFGWVKLKAGYERRLQASVYDTNDGRVEMQGLGANLQFVLKPWVEFGGGAGHKVEDVFNQFGAPSTDSSTTWTAGGFLNVKPYFDGWLVGLGYHHTYWENFNFDPSGEPENKTHDQMYGAVQYRLFNTLFIKYVLSYANAHIENRVEDPADTGFYNSSLSHRLRFMILW
jgi:hypothetical protein